MLLTKIFGGLRSLSKTYAGFAGKIGGWVCFGGGLYGFLFYTLIAFAPEIVIAEIGSKARAYTEMPRDELYILITVFGIVTLLGVAIIKFRREIRGHP